ncbi:MAG: type II secretion system secretin GspD [Pseudomonadota bacterium]
MIRPTAIILLMLLFNPFLIPPALGARVTDAVDSSTAKSPAGAETPEVTLDFRDVDIRVVAKFISELTGRNFIFDNKVREKVTVFSPTKVTPEEAYQLFEMVLKIHGFTTVPTGGIIQIVPSQDARTMDVETRAVLPGRSEAKDDRVVTQLIRLKHADAAEMRGLMQPLMARSGLLMSYDSGNILIVTDYASNIDRLVSIIRAVDVEDEGARLSVIKINHASAKDMASELEVVLKGPAQKGQQAAGRLDYKVVPDERTNSLIILARQSETKTIRDLVRELDAPSPRGSDRIHVYFLKNAVAEDLAKVLSELTGKEAAAQQKGGPSRLVLQEEVFITAEKATNSLIIRAERQDFLVLKNIIEQLDIQRAQVLVEGVIMEMSVSKANSLGAEWRLLDFPEEGSNAITGFGGTNLPGESTSGLISSVMSNPFSGAGGLVLGAARGTITYGDTTYLNIGALVQALESDSDINILSTPHLLTMDNEEARIVVGEERPFLKSSLATDTGSTSPSITKTYDFKDLGLTLKITPHITQGEYVKLKIFQELKSFKSEVEAGAVTSTKREAETTVQVRDGETVVIGGLIDDTGREVHSKVPCLGSVPLLGWAFKTRSQSADKKNLLILISPTIVRTADQLKTLTEKKRLEMKDSVGQDSMDFKTFPPKGLDMLKD